MPQGRVKRVLKWEPVGGFNLSATNKSADHIHWYSISGRFRHSNCWLKLLQSPDAFARTSMQLLVPLCWLESKCFCNSNCVWERQSLRRIWIVPFYWMQSLKWFATTTTNSIREYQVFGCRASLWFSCKRRSKRVRNWNGIYIYSFQWYHHFKAKARSSNKPC